MQVPGDGRAPEGTASPRLGYLRDAAASPANNEIMEEVSMATSAHKDQGHLAYPYGRVSSDEEVLSQILNAFHHHSGVPQECLRVEVSGGHVVLSGMVSQEFERALAEQIAVAAPGVEDVTNQISLES
jgi:osmotically-inducible protein OsmY